MLLKFFTNGTLAEKEEIKKDTTTAKAAKTSLFSQT